MMNPIRESRPVSCKSLEEAEKALYERNTGKGEQAW